MGDGVPNRKGRDRTVSKATLAKRHLSIVIFCSILYFNGGCTCEKKIAPSLKRHLFSHGDRVKMLAQSLSKGFRIVF